MKIGIIGSGSVAQTLGSAFLARGHDVMISSRDVKKGKENMMGKIPSVTDWVSAHRGGKAHGGSFAEAAAFGELLFNCTTGVASIDALNAAGKANLKGKILVDVANPLDFSKGMPPSLAFCNTESLGERIQKAFPETKVVKVFNTVSAPVMVNPAMVPGEHDLFMCGNDAAAKKKVTTDIVKPFGWKTIHDLGDITNARGTEMYLPLWVRLWGALQTPAFNIRIVRGK